MMDSGPDDANGVGAEAMTKASFLVIAIFTGACTPTVEPQLLKGAAEKTTDPGIDPAKTVAKSVPAFGEEARAIEEALPGKELVDPSPRKPAQPEIANTAAMVRKR
jgi:hypothetical protein